MPTERLQHQEGFRNEESDPERPATQAEMSSQRPAAPLTLTALTPASDDDAAVSPPAESPPAESLSAESLSAESLPVSWPQRIWRSWWVGDGGAQQLLLIAVPLIVSTISFTIMQFCDRMFLAWYSTDAVAAVMPAGALCFTTFSLPMGIAGYAGTFIAQYLGAGQADRVGPILWQTHRVGLYAMPLFLLAALASPTIFGIFGHAAELLWLEVLYYQILAFGSSAIVFGAGLTAFFVGRGRTAEIMVVDTLAAAANVGLDYLLIFGWGDLPAMGIEGAAWATTVAMWLKVVFLVGLVYQPRYWKAYRLLQGRGWDAALLLRLLRFGVPNGMQFVIEGSAITLFILFIGQLGTTAAAATTIAFSVNMLAFFPVFGLGMALTTVVGQQLGRKHPAGASRATWVAMSLAIVYTLIFSLLYLLLPDLFINAFGEAVEEGAEVKRVATVLLLFVAAYCVLDAVQLIFVSTLKGAGDTLFVLGGALGVALLLVGVGAASSTWGGAWANSVFWWWGVISGWVWAMALVFGWRFWQGRWRSMSVIDENATPLPLDPEALTERPPL